MDSTVKLSDLNDFISCPICQGYLIEATTVSECLHTFCKSCIVKHIKNDHNECPKCKIIIHERRPLDYIIHDRNKQDIVYKLVPQLYISELNKRMAAHEPLDIDSMTRLVLEKQFLHVVLIQQICNPNYIINPKLKAKEPRPIYLRCPLTVTIGHIRKLLIAKYQLKTNDRVSLLYKGDIVSDNDQISNLAQSLTFCLHYEISKSAVLKETDPIN